MWNDGEIGASIVLQFAGTELEKIPAGANISILDDENNVLATNTAKIEQSIKRNPPAKKYGTTTTFIYENPNYDGSSWKTTEGSVSSLEQIKKIKVEYTIANETFVKIVDAQVYDVDIDG